MDFKFVPRECTTEKKDCTVRAIQNAFGVPYMTAHKLLADYGRKEQRGCNFEDFMLTLKGSYNNITFKKHIYYKSINQFTAENPKGIFIIQVNKHVFAMIDGVQYDTSINSGRRIVKHYYAIGYHEPKPNKVLRIGRKVTQREQVAKLMKTHTIDQIVEKTGIKKTNVAWYVSRIKKEL